MAVVTTVPKQRPIDQNGYVANEDLSSSQYCAVVDAGASDAIVKVGLPSGQGVRARGILQNAPDEDEVANVMELGRSKGKAGEAFDSGVELTVLNATGVLEEAASGDYVCAISDEPATAANQIVRVKVVTPYQKN